jgi:translation elongation factor EF-1beta
MRNTIIKRLDIPKSTIINRKIAKQHFFTQGNLTKSEKELFTSEIESIYLLSACNQNRLGVPKFTNDQMRYVEVDWIYVKFRSTVRYQRLIRVMHRTLPNPLVVIAEGEQSNLSFSASHKRLNQNDDSNVVIENIEITPWIDIDNDDEVTGRLIERINFNHLSYANLYYFYDDVHLAIQFSYLIDDLNCYPLADVDRDELKSLLDALQFLNTVIYDLNQLQKEQIEFGKKMELHIKIKQKEQQQNQLHQQIKEMC